MTGNYAVGPDLSDLNSDITMEEVRKAVFSAKLNKATGIDEIPSEVLRNDVSITMLYHIIRFCFQEGEVPVQWRQTIVTPILKADKDPRDPLGYRGISLISVPCKVFADVLNQRLIKWLESNDILVEEQNGFRRDRSCLDHLYTLTNVIKNRKNAKKSSYVCFIDMKKAFDCVNRDLLWYKLMALGVSGKFLDAAKSLYSDMECSVKVNDRLTPFFPVTKGVKQGCKISPTLFAAYINDLATDINALRCGVDIDDINLAILLFADDIALIAPDAQSLQSMLNVVHTWCKKWRLTVNRDKTKIVHFRPQATPRANFRFTCGDIELDYETKYRYLGLWLDEHLNFKHSVNELCKSASRALGALYSKFIYAGGMTYNVFNKLYKSVVEPVLYYAAGIWGTANFPKVNTIQNRAARLYLGTAKNASNIATRGDMGWSSCLHKQYIEVFRLYFRLLNSPDSRLLHIVHEWSKTLRFSWEKRVMHIINKFELNDYINLPRSVKVKLGLIKEVLDRKDSLLWYDDLHNDRGNLNGNKLRTYRLYKDNLATESYVKNVYSRQERRILSNFRCGSLPLAIETGRYTVPKTPLHDRICQFCTANVLEDEMHFLLHCEFYTDIRFKLFYHIETYFSFIDFYLMSDIEKLNFIMNTEQLQPKLSKVLTDMFRRRKEFL